jgi:hypothetical protein
MAKTGMKMKNSIIFLIIAVFIGTGIMAAGKSALEEFSAKAKKISLELAKANKEIASAEKKYAATQKRIDTLKASKRSFISEWRLNYDLRSGSRLAYRISGLEDKIKILKEDYFTFASIVVEEYNRKVKDCIEAKCPDLKKIYVEREEWAGAVESDDIMQVEIFIPEGPAQSGKDAKEDILSYLEKADMACEQRIMILKEEKETLDALKKAGIVINIIDFDSIDKKISSLNGVRNKIAGLQRQFKAASAPQPAKKPR